MSSSTSTRSPLPATSASSAFARVVLPLLVPPATRMFCRSCTATRRYSAWVGLRMPPATYCCSGMTPAARLRRAKVGPATTGGSTPSKRSPVSGSSALSSGLLRCTSWPTCAATRRMIRSPSPAASVPNLERPAERRSSQSTPSGLSITSTTSGSSRAAAISGPIAVRSMCVRRFREAAAAPSTLEVAAVMDVLPRPEPLPESLHLRL
ncbi:hypothetical protein D9M70_528030 [compost metagenome]